MRSTPDSDMNGIPNMMGITSTIDEIMNRPLPMDCNRRGTRAVSQDHLRSNDK